MYSNKILGNTDCLIVLMVGDFENSIIEKIFTQNFLNIITAKNTTDAMALINHNHIDVVLCQNSDLFNTFTFVEQIKQVDEKMLTVLVANSLNSDDLLKCIDLKLDCYLLENSQSDVLLKPLNKMISKYLTYKNHERFGTYFNEQNENIIVSKTDTDGIITYVNDAFCDTSGYSRRELLGSNHNIIRHPDNKKSIFENLWFTIRDKKSIWEGIVKNITKKNESYYAKSFIIPILDKNEEIVEYIGYRVNISEMISDENRLLNNIESNELSVLALIQIEEYDMLEEFYNKELIKKIEDAFANSLLSNLPDKELFNRVYSLGFGRYALLCNFYKFMEKNKNIEKYFDKVVEKTNNSILDIDGFKNAFEDDLNIVLSFSYGKQSLFEDAKHGLEETIFNNKTVHNSNDACLIDQRFAQNNMNIIKMVKVALDNYKIVSYFQPIINNKTRVIEKYESLVRLIDEKNRVLEPVSFLNVAKASRYNNKITHRVLENSFNVLCKINTEISINISMSDIQKEEIRDVFFELLHENKEHAHKLVLELLEDENVNDLKVIKNFIVKAKSKGVKIAIDDFGSGYSNFERLLIFEPDIIKIDGTLIKDIEKDIYSRNLVETIVSLSKKQNIKTVAEYVENENIFNILNEIGIDYSQGYFFGKPEQLNLNSKQLASRM